MILGLAAQQARFGRLPYSRRRRYLDEYDEDGPPLWALCFLAASSVIALSYSVVLFGSYWRGDREAAVRAYSASVRNWTKYREELLHTNFSVHATWNQQQQQPKVGPEMNLRKDAGELEAMSGLTAQDSEVGSDLPDVFFLSYTRHPVPAPFLPSLNFTNLADETAVFTFTATTAPSKDDPASSADKTAVAASSTMATLPVPLWTRRTVPGATPVPERKCPEQQRGVYVGSGKCEIYQRLSSICVRAGLVESPAPAPPPSSSSSSSSSSSPPADSYSNRDKNNKNKAVQHGRALLAAASSSSSSSSTAAAAAAAATTIAVQEDAKPVLERLVLAPLLRWVRRRLEGEPSSTSGEKVMHWELTPHKAGEPGSVGCERGGSGSSSSSSSSSSASSSSSSSAVYRQWGPATYVSVRPTISVDRTSGARRYHFPPTSLDDVRVTLRSDHDPYVELTKATKGNLDFGLSANHALTISVLLLCLGVLLCVPPGCALFRCYKRDLQDYRSEFHNYSNYRSQRRPYSRVRASTDDDIPMDDDAHAGGGGGDDDESGGTDVGGISLGEFGGGGGGGSSGDESSTGSINGSKRVDIELTSRNKQVRRL